MIPEAECKKGCVLDTMGTTTAQLRHRELTQEIYNIGDEVADYIEHIMEAISDWDDELVDDCLAEFEEIIAEARDDSRTVVAELLGLRHALTSGLRQGTVSARSAVRVGLTQPERITASQLEDTHPIGEIVMVGDMAAALNARTEAIVAHLEQVVDWVLAQTACAADDLDAVSLPMVYGRVADDVCTSTRAWLDVVADAHPDYVWTKRGCNPPSFLLERARIDSVVARVAERMQDKRGQVS